MEFVDKVAFITGGAIGFGRAFARALGERGASVILADIDISAARETAASLAEAGISALALECDVADEHAVEVAVAESVRRLGGIDILINNAGKHLTKYNQPFGKLPRHEVRALFDVNVMGVVNCTVACQPTMKQRGGGIVVNIASIAANLSSTPYGVSKLAVRGLTLAFATELAADGIRVNAISPGLMATENALDDLPQDFIDDFVNNRQLVRRLGRMDDIVEAMLFLCSEKSSFMTGETLRVSGGYPLGFD
ncbi:MAG: short-chain dehydrogenase [Porticoccaceae bacterium]|nr:short-chain dehydrogenase [Porticoccaceae bacterium]